MSLKIQTYIQMLAHLAESPVSAQDLAAMTGVHVSTARELLQGLHKRKLLRIAAWDTRYNRRIKLPMYTLGEGVDVPKPKRLPSAEVQRRYKERQKLRAKFDPFFAMCRPVGMAVSNRTDPTESRAD